MQKIVIYFFVLLNTSIFGQNKVEPVKHFGQNKGNLKMYTYIPKSLDTTIEVPLVVVLHGCSQSARSVAYATGWNKLADSLNFIILYPQQRRINNMSKCFNYFIPFKAKKDRGEVASIKHMIDYVIKEENIDKTKIFITGLSAGGAMSHALLNAYPQLFNAGALLGTPSTLLDLVSTSSKQPRVLIIQGDKDMLAHKSNGERLINKWCSKHRIESDSYIFTDNINGNSLLSTRTFSKNNENVLVYLLIKELGHRLPIDPGEDIKHGGKNGIFTKNIGFFSTYYIAEFFGLTND